MIPVRAGPCLLVLVLSSSVAAGFAPLANRGTRAVRLSAEGGTPKGPAGSFFNPVPDDSDSSEDSDDAASDRDDMEDELFKVLRQRKGSSQASQPSTINGVPTSKATGFGAKKPSGKKSSSSKPYISIGPPDRPVNDPTKPEYDDQGYTLYSDEKTGEKSRVFEALVDYPCKFTLKIVGANEGAFVEEIVALVAETCETDADSLTHSTRNMGKWTSVTVQAPVQNAEMLYTLYEQVDRDPRVKFKF